MVGKPRQLGAYGFGQRRDDERRIIELVVSTDSNVRKATVGDNDDAAMIAAQFVENIPERPVAEPDAAFEPRQRDIHVDGTDNTRTLRTERDGVARQELERLGVAGPREHRHAALLYGDAVPLPGRLDR